MNRLGNIGSVKIDPKNPAPDIEALKKVIQDEFDYVEKNAIAKSDGLVSGTFLTADTPAKTVTIRNGIIVSIQ
jgi:hypothetical protein